MSPALSEGLRQTFAMLPALLFVTGLLFTAGALGRGCPEADAEALQWLDKMSRSVHQVSYHGVVTYQLDGEDMQVVQVSHSVQDGTSFERMTQLTGQGAEVVRLDHPLECIHPGHRLLRLGEELGEGNCGIARQYRFSVTPGDRVAGRKAVRVSIVPRDMYRFGYVMELDRRNGLLLKTATLGRGGKVLEKFQFADLSYGDRMPEGVETSLVHRAKHPVPGGDTAQAPALAHNWSVGWLPAGFIPTDAQPPRAGRKTYTDGLAVFSVFVEELQREIRPGEGVVNKGSTTSYTRGMLLADEPVLVTVVGEVPVNTARMVADSIKWAR